MTKATALFSSENEEESEHREHLSYIRVHH